MELDIKGDVLSGGTLVRRQASRRALVEFGRFGERVASVRIRIAERRPPASPRYHCGVGVRVIDGQGSTGLVLSQGQDDDVMRAVEIAIARAGTKTGGEIARADEALRARRRWVVQPAAMAGGGVT